MTEPTAEPPQASNATPAEVFDVLNQFQQAGTEGAQPLGSMPKKDAATSDSEPGFSFLQSLLRRTVFFDYFVHVATHVNADLPAAQRVQALRKNHKFYYHVCIGLDLILRLALALGLTAAGFWAVWKTLQ